MAAGDDSSGKSVSYRALDAGKIIVTATQLAARIQQRFPDSSLARIGNELVRVAEDSNEQSLALSRPNWAIRAAAVLASAALLAVAAVTLYQGYRSFREVAATFSELAQGIDASVNEMLLLSAAIYFLVTLERRRRCATALRALHELRSLAHIIDMHQLTKDPEVFASDWQPTTASPDRARMTPFQLERYLDYCSEMLAILSKVAALYVQRIQDESVLRAVDDLEDLTIGLSRKIWQKITILERLRGRT
jgi:hypothetical protein